MLRYLQPSAIVDADHPDVARFALRHVAGGEDRREAAVRLYYAVRDGIRYDPYRAGADVASLRASETLRQGRSWCVGKAVLLAACCRARGIPARLGFADVKNHLSTARLRAMMGTDVFYWHGYTSIWLDGRWVKATPAFNAELCAKFRLATLEFDGRHDSIYQPFDLEGNRHMEYLRQRGEFADPPLEAMLATWREHYPEKSFTAPATDFDAEVEAETGA